MRTKDYIEALYQTLRSGADIDVVLARLTAVLERRGLTKLRPRILRGLSERLGRAQRAGAPKVIVAREKDVARNNQGIQDALKDIGSGAEYELHIDPTIIGGFITTGSGKRVDRSFKSTLLRAYHRVIN